MALENHPMPEVFTFRLLVLGGKVGSPERYPVSLADNPSSRLSTCRAGLCGSGPIRLSSAALLILSGDDSKHLGVQAFDLALHCYDIMAAVDFVL